MTKYFYLTAADAVSWLTAAEQAVPLVYALVHGSGTKPITFKKASLLGIPAEPKVFPNGSVDELSFLVQKAPYKFTAKRSKDPNEISHSVFPGINLGTVVLRFCGVVSNTHIAPGNISCMSRDPEALKLLGFLWRKLGRIGRTRGMLSIGPAALALHRSGYRLCTYLAADPAIDPRFDEEETS